MFTVIPVIPLSIADMVESYVYILNDEVVFVEEGFLKFPHATVNALPVYEYPVGNAPLI